VELVPLPVRVLLAHDPRVLVPVPQEESTTLVVDPRIAGDRANEKPP